MSGHDSLYQQLRAHLAYLNLGAAAEALPAQLEAARTDKQGHTEFLEQLLRIEVEATEQRRWEGRMRFANLPAPWRLDDFDFAAQPSVDQALLRELATCAYTGDATNVLFIGPPGVGKTMLAIALGHAAVDAGHRVYYTTAADLAARCRRAALEGRWATTTNSSEPVDVRAHEARYRARTVSPRPSVASRGERGPPRRRPPCGSPASPQPCRRVRRPRST